jgi:hypothetical protein
MPFKITDLGFVVKAEKNEVHESTGHLCNSENLGLYHPISQRHLPSHGMVGTYTLLIITEWNTCQVFSLGWVKCFLWSSIIIENRNFLDSELVRTEGLVYEGAEEAMKRLLKLRNKDLLVISLIEVMLVFLRPYALLKSRIYLYGTKPISNSI